MRIDAGGRARNWTDEQFALIAGTFRRWAERAHGNGYAIGPETHWGAENYPDNMLKLAPAVDHPGYGILLHMGKDVTGDPDAYDRALAPLAIHTHVDALVAVDAPPSARDAIGSIRGYAHAKTRRHEVLRRQGTRRVRRGGDAFALTKRTRPLGTEPGLVARLRVPVRHGNRELDALWQDSAA